MKHKDQILSFFKDFVEGKIPVHQYCNWLEEQRENILSLFNKETLRDITINKVFFEERENEFHYRMCQVLSDIGKILLEENINFSNKELDFHREESIKIHKEEEPIRNFRSKMDNFLLKSPLRCEIGGLELGPFTKRIYKKYCEDGSPRKINDWMTANLLPEFICLHSTLPKWHAKNQIISWPVYGDMPAIFLKQFDVFDESNQKILEEKFVHGITVYVFGYQVQTEDGFEIKYTVFDHVTNDTSQSIEEHYKEEEKRMKKEEKQRKAKEK
jgi:hypothetical protein